MVPLGPAVDVRHFGIAAGRERLNFYAVAAVAVATKKGAPGPFFTRGSKTARIVHIRQAYARASRSSPRWCLACR